MPSRKYKLVRLTHFRLTHLIALSLAAVNLFSPRLSDSMALGQSVTNYGDFAGEHVDFLAVTEETLTPNDPDAMLGAPLVKADTIDFDPMGFAAETVGPQSDQTQSRLTFDLMAKASQAIRKLAINQAGDISLSRTPLSDASASVQIMTRLDITILELDNQPLPDSGLSLPTLEMEYPQPAGLFSLEPSGTGAPTLVTSWDSSAEIDLAALLAREQLAGNVTGMSLSLETMLIANSQADSAAAIALGDSQRSALEFEIELERFVAIPEPATWLGGLIGLTFCFGIVPRRSRTSKVLDLDGH